MSLIPGEVRQGMIHLIPRPNTKPGDLFVLDIRHEIVGGGRTKTPKVIGGLVVIVRAMKSPQVASQ